MPEISWYQAVDLVRPFVVKISHPLGTGTGFLFAYSADKDTCGVATAAHVVAHAHDWRQPIRLSHLLSGEEVFLSFDERGIILDNELDTAAIVFSASSIPFPKQLLQLSPEGKHLKQGADLGWVGFPAVSPQNLCFFSGHVSAYLTEEEYYLVDGVVINGVSGGPAFTTGPAKSVTLAGIITAYMPNWATSGPLPGLGKVSDVSHLQGVVGAFKSVDEAKRRQSPPGSSGTTTTSPTMSGA